jgi:hypothetical protein
VCRDGARVAIRLTGAMTTTPARAVPRRGRTWILTATALTATCLGGLSACGGGADLDAAEKEGKNVGDAIKAQSEKADSDITAAISEEPWKSPSGVFVSGTYDFLVVNVDEKACAKLVFDSDEAGADYEIEKTYDC